MDICCPICKGSGTLNAPTFKQKALQEKRKTAISLKKQGYSIREIMKIMGYKSPRSIQTLIK
jgi:transposase